MKYREELNLRIARLLSELTDEQFEIFLDLLFDQLQCDDETMEKTKQIYSDFQ